jgi:hypothetical protein
MEIAPEVYLINESINDNESSFKITYILIP